MPSTTTTTNASTLSHYIPVSDEVLEDASSSGPTICDLLDHARNWHGPPKPAHLKPDRSWAAAIDWDVLPDELQAVIDEEVEARRDW